MANNHAIASTRSLLLQDHCNQIIDVKSQITIYCKYCPASWILQGSTTSTALKHIKNRHPEKLTAKELSMISQEYTSPTASLPKRSLSRNQTDMGPEISCNSWFVRKCDRKLAMAVVSGAVPINICESPAFASFCETLNPGYRLPSRAYMTGTVIPSLYNEDFSRTPCHNKSSKKRSPVWNHVYQVLDDMKKYTQK